MLLPINTNDVKVLVTALEIYIGELRVLAESVVSPVLRNGFQDDMSAVKSLLEEIKRASKPSVLEMDKVIRDYLRLEQKINAIKYVREVTGKSLKDAKDYVDAIQARMAEEKMVAEQVAKAAVNADWDRDTGNGFNERGYPAGHDIYHDPMG